MPKEWMFWFSIRVKKDGEPQRGSAQVGPSTTGAHWVRAVRPAGCGAMGDRQVQISSLSLPMAERLGQGEGLAVPPWKHRGEHINMLELRAVINEVLWRLRSAANIHSKGGPSNGLDGDFGSFGKRAFQIVALGAFGHEVQFARGCSIFHPLTRALPDRPQSG